MAHLLKNQRNQFIIGWGALTHGSPSIFGFRGITPKPIRYSDQNECLVTHFDGKVPILTPKVDNIASISILPEFRSVMKILSEIIQLHEIDVNCMQKIEVRMRFRIRQAYFRQHFVCTERNRSYFFRPLNHFGEKRCTHSVSNRPISMDFMRRTMRGLSTKNDFQTIIRLF